MTDVTSQANSENGLVVENFRRATLKDSTSTDNAEDGLQAENIGFGAVEASAFANNMDDGIDISAVRSGVVKDLEVFGNRDRDVEGPNSTSPPLVPGPIPVRQSSTITVTPGLDTLLAAVEIAQAGDTLQLQAGLYLLSDTVTVDKNLTIQGIPTSADQVHIVPVIEGFAGVHLLSATAAADNVAFANITIKGAPDFGEEALQQGDGIHTEGVENVTITNVQASLNAGDGIFFVGAIQADLSRITALANGEFGIDTDGALNVTVSDSNLNANGISGLEAAGHDSPSITFTAVVTITNTLALYNAEIGIEVERFERATLASIICSHNVEDGFDADRVYVVEISDSTFANNLDDGLELFPVDVEDFPPDFPFSIIEMFSDLTIFGNRGLTINHPLTED
jgi:hypothetical protein